MTTFSIKYQQINNWFNKGLLFWKLRASDVKTQDSLQQALESLIVGLLIALLVEFLVLFYYIPKAQFINFLGFPLYGIVIIANTAFFVLSLLISLWALRTDLEPSLIVTLTIYRLSAAIPLLMLFTSAQLSEAIRLFIIHRDFGLPYMYTAIHNLLFSEQALRSVVVRNWILSLFQVAVYTIYILWGLISVLIEASSAPRKLIKIVIAVIIACIVNAVWVYSYFGRLYWWIMSGLLRG